MELLVTRLLILIKRRLYWEERLMRMTIQQVLVTDQTPLVIQIYAGRLQPPQI